MTRRIPTLILMLGLAPTLAAAGQVHTGTPTPPTTSGQPLSLAACLTIAHEHQPDLAASEAQVRAAEARLKESHALFRPRIDFGQSYTRQSYNFAAAPGNTPTQVSLFSQPESFANTPYYYAGLTYSQTIYDFGRTRGTVRRSEAELEGSRQDLQRLRDVVDLNVRTSYYSVLAAEELVRIRQDAVDNESKHFEQVTAFYEVGRRPKIDVTNQKVALANAQVDLRQAQETLDVARAALATSMGLPIEQAPEPVNTLKEQKEHEDLSHLLADAERIRPDIQSLKEQIAASEADLVVARSAFRPSFALASFFDYRNLKFPLIYNWSLGELMAQNLFAGGADRARLAEVRAQLDAAQANLASLVQRVRQEVYTDYSDLQVAQDKINLAITAERAAQENLELAEGRYQTGYGNIIELTDAQTLWTNSQAQEITTRYDYQIAAGRLTAAVGRPVQ
ncbi:MAG TPA: TolC family protein [Terriglobia bacterium]|nr:TolC family protein [Terriglobia bacterium]